MQQKRTTQRTHSHPLHELLRYRVAHERRRRLESERFPDAGPVELDGLLAEPDAPRDVGRRLAPGDELQDLALPLGERIHAPASRHAARDEPTLVCLRVAEEGR